MYSLKTLKSVVLLSSPLLLLSAVNAQITSSSAPSPAATREAITRTVEVSKGDHTFVPDVTQAEVGDFIEFRFHPTNHSVVRAAYGYPCIPYELIETDKVGFTSGFHPVDAVIPDPPTWTVRVNDSDPIFYYCSAPGSCINYAMVGVINPNATTSLDRQKKAAEDSTFMLQPGENWPDESHPPGSPGSNPLASGSSTGSATKPTSSDSNAPASTTAAAAAAGRHSGLSGGAIAGIAIGAAVVAIMAATLIYLCGRNRAMSDLIRPRWNSPGPRPGEADGGGIQYVQTVPKHASAMTMVSPRADGENYGHLSPALPGYRGPHEGVHSPPRPHYAPSDALSPATSAIRSPSPGSSVVPAYTQWSPAPSQGYPERPRDGLHEMDGGGGFYRPSSMQKTGVERYS